MGGGSIGRLSVEFSQSPSVVINTFLFVSTDFRPDRFLAYREVIFYSSMVIFDAGKAAYGTAPIGRQSSESTKW
jgi:hypothetical protein